MIHSTVTSIMRKSLSLNRWTIILKFCSYFCLQYALTISFYDFDLSFLKLILKRTLHGLLQGKVYLSFSVILKQNDYPSSFFDNSCIHFFKLYLLINLIQWNCLYLSMSFIMYTVFTVSGKRQEKLKTRKQDGSCQRIQGFKEMEINQVLMKLMSNDDEVDKMKFNNDEADKLKNLTKKQKRYSDEEVDWYTIWK